MIQCCLKGVATDVIEEHVPFFGASLCDLLIEIALLVINGVIKARLFGEPGTLFGAASNTNDAAAFDLGDLPGNRACGARRTRDQHGLAGLGVAEVQKTKVGSETCHAQHREHHFRGCAFRHRPQA